MNHAHVSRPREKPSGNEEAGANLSLGEFAEDYALSNSEARLLINTIVDKQRNINPGYKESEALIRTNDHLDLFARFKNTTSVTELESLLTAHTTLTAFEKSQLGSLCCGDAEEAKSLIPSLAQKITDEDLNILTEQLEDLRKESERGEMQ